jgi:hypothetical protein
MTTAINNEDESTASLKLAISVVKYFELDEKDAGKIGQEVGEAVSTGRDEAARQGIGRTRLTGALFRRPCSAFRHALLVASWGLLRTFLDGILLFLVAANRASENLARDNDFDTAVFLTTPSCAVVGHWVVHAKTLRR